MGRGTGVWIIPGDPYVSFFDKTKLDERKTGKSGVSDLSMCPRIRVMCGLLLEPRAVIMLVLMPCCSLRGFGHATTGEGRVRDGVGVGAWNTAVFVIVTEAFIGEDAGG